MAGDHSSKQYDQELEAIRSKVLLMGGMVETQFDEAVNAFRVGNVEAADKVMGDDHAVNQLEVQLDDACSHLIVRRQPAANDLRTVMATIKVITDLERIGDEAAKIARTAKSLHERGLVVGHHLVGLPGITDAEGVQRLVELGFHHAAHEQHLGTDAFQFLVVLLG